MEWCSLYRLEWSTDHISNKFLTDRSVMLMLVIVPFMDLDVLKVIDSIALVTHLNTGGLSEWVNGGSITQQGDV